MEKMVFKKFESLPLAQFLESLELKNKNSRLRNKLIKKLNVISEELEEDRVALAEEHAEKDEQGKPISKDNVYKIIDLDEFNKQLEELKNGEVAIEVGEYSNNLEDLFNYLDSEEFDMPLSGQPANRYDRLLDIWEETKKEKELKKETKPKVKKTKKGDK